MFDTETLRSKAQVDPLISDSKRTQIEEVDLVGDACDIAVLLEKMGPVGEIDFILSSPKRPSPATIFDANANQIRFLYGDFEDMTTTLDRRVAPEAVLCFDFEGEYRRFQKELEDPEPYTDTHCNILIPELFELYLRDLSYLGLMDFEVVEISQTHGIEFFAHLKKQTTHSKPTAEEYQKTRARLLRSVSEQLGSAAFGQKSLAADASRVDKIRRVARSVIGTRAVDAVRSWNRQRRLNRKERKA
ncbi:MAG: hypothetical protein ABJQ34_00295 [Paracoccaceae bacterium]